MNLTLDASVVVKWHVANPEEKDSEQAVLLLDAIIEGSVELVEPPHALAEIAAVLSRILPEGAESRFEEVCRIFANGKIVSDNSVYWKAIELSRRLDHHLFDTLYHAVALESGATLITADERYFSKAEELGRILLLGRFSSSAASLAPSGSLR